MIDAQKYKKWLRWLDTISHEMTLLVWSNNLYKEIREIVAANPAINTGNKFYDWLTRNYVHTTLMGLRRQLDRHKDAISLFKLLDDMKANYSLLTREYHLSLYSRDMRSLGERIFDQLSGEGRNTYPKEKIEADRQQLEGIAVFHKGFIDRRIAHYDKVNRLETLPTIQDLYNAVDHVEKTVIKYHLLLKAETLRLLPITQYDWKAIFRSPWITEEPSA
jgi:hypothetical protein